MAIAATAGVPAEQELIEASGSGAEQVIRHAPVPVLVIRDDRPNP